MRLIGKAPDYALQHHIFRGLEETERRYRQRTGDRLVVLPWPPYFRYEHGETSSLQKKAS
jgi:hypothetical protein